MHQETAKADLGALKPQKMEYQTLRGASRSDEDNVVQGVKGLTDAQINAAANQGWRAIHVQMSGRKIIAVVMERPRVSK
jgi:hypothetical protein